MRTQIFFIAFFISFIQSMNSQILISCGDTQPLAVDNENSSLFFESKYCNDDFKISIDKNNLRDDENVVIESDIILDSKSISIIGNIDHIIYLKPPNTSNNSGKDVYVYDNKEVMPDESRIRLKTTQRESKEEPIKTELDSGISLYPNPADTNLSIDTELTIISYIIKDIQGNIYLEGNIPDNNTISVNTLQTGLYYITIVTVNETIQKPFTKN